MTTLFIVWSALILAVMGRAILVPLPSREARAVAEERAQMMEAVTMLVF